MREKLNITPTYTCGRAGLRDRGMNRRGRDGGGMS